MCQKADLTPLDGGNIWIVDGDVVPWFGMPYTTRTTVVRLSGDRLWIHSPGAITESLKRELDSLGDVGYLISPNKIHHLYLSDWQSLYPDALLFASPGLADKRQDITFDQQLSDYPDSEWAAEIDQLIFRGSPIMEEVVFFHRQSKTLILTDLIENFPENHFKGIKKVLAKLSGIVSPRGKTPIDWRISFLMGKSKARACFQRMLAWEPQRIVIAHGECIFSDATKFLKESFSWLR